MYFPDSSVGKESTHNAGDPGSIPGSGRSAGEGVGYPLQYSWASLVAQLVKNLPAMWQTWVLSLGWEDPLEKGKATNSSILAWRIPWTKVHGVTKSWTRLSDFHWRLSGKKNSPANAGDLGHTGLIPELGRSPGEGNGNSLQYSCLENPMDIGAWQATVHGVTKSWTQLSGQWSMVQEH